MQIEIRPISGSGSLFLNITTNSPISSCPLMADPLTDDAPVTSDWFEEALQTEAPILKPRASTWSDDDEEPEEEDDPLDDGDEDAEEIEADPFDDFDEEDFDDDFDDDFEEELEDEYEIEPADDGAVEDLNVDDDEEGLDDEDAV